MNRREASKKETRGLILKAARRLFARKGMEECTLRDIAAKAGVSPASVVVHFKSKTALLDEALHGEIERALSELTALMPDGPDLHRRLMHISKGMLDFYAANRNLYRTLISRTVFEPETPSIARQSRKFNLFLSGMIEEHKALGLIRPEVDSEAAAFGLFSLYMGAIILLFRMPDMPVGTIAGYLDSTTRHYLKGISKGDV